MSRVNVTAGPPVGIGSLALDESLVNNEFTGPVQAQIPVFR